MTCYISDQVARYCDEDEYLCSECGDTMSFDDDNDLVCDDVECGHIVILTPDE